MREMPHGHCSFLLDVGEEGALVVDFEGEDAVLVGESEGSGEGGCIGGGGGSGGQGEAVKGREHGDFELEGVVGRGEGEGDEVGVGVFGEGDAVGLWVVLDVDVCMCGSTGREGKSLRRRS